MIRTQYYNPVRIIVVLLVLLSATSLRADITIVLQNDFIEHYKRRVTIDAEFLVDKAHKRPNPASKDGDLHVAGRAEEIKLPTVAEIMNARDDETAVDDIHAAQGTGIPIKLSGVWRLWCEHAGDEQIQGKELQPFTTTNPDHVFEVHPVTKLKGRDLLHTLKPIVGFKTKDAHDAFAKYEGLRCKIIPDSDTTTVVTTMAGYNYVEFVMEINSQPQDSEDGGLLAMCKILDLDQELLVRNRRMVMVKGSKVEQMVRGKPVGTRVHVLGLPRINLSLLSWRVKEAAKGREDVLTWGLPYEIIVVGFYEFIKSEEDEDDTAIAVTSPPKNGKLIPKSFTAKDIENRRRVTSSPSSSTELDVPLEKPKLNPKNTLRTDNESPRPRVVLPEAEKPKAKIPKVKAEDLIEEK